MTSGAALKRFVLVAATGLGSLWCLHAQQGHVPPCPDPASMKERIERICGELLPFDGRIHLRTPQGGTCFCECAGLHDKAIKEVREMRAQRAAIYAKRYKAFNAQIPEGGIHGGPTAHPSPSGCGACEHDADELGGCVKVCGWLPCEEDKALKDALQAIADSRLLGDEECPATYTVHYMSEAACCKTVAFPNIDTGPDWPVITMPASLIRHPEVGHELAVFFVLHEIGHGVTRTVDRALNCEGNVDAWALEVGFNAVFGTRFGEAVTAMLEQFDAYHKDVIRTDLLGMAFPDEYGGLCLNAYPKLECRKGLLEEVATVAISSDDLSDIAEHVTRYHELHDCWEPATFTLDVLSAERTIRCGDDCGGDTTGGVVPVGPVGSAAELTWPPWLVGVGPHPYWKDKFADLLASICKRCPDLCGRTPGPCQVWLRPGLVPDKRFHQEMHRYLVRLEKSLSAKIPPTAP